MLQGKHILRLRFFPNGNGDGEEIIKFLKDNCDVREATQDGADGSKERPTYYLTGVGIQHYIGKLQDAFNCR